MTIIHPHKYHNITAIASVTSVRHDSTPNTFTRSSISLTHKSDRFKIGEDTALSCTVTSDNTPPCGPVIKDKAVVLSIVIDDR